MSNAEWDERILRVVDHVHAHLDEPLEAVQLARLAEFSPHHFHRVFRGFTGESLMAFVRRLRLERAAQRLRFGQASVTSIALNSGYGSHEAFTRAFKHRFGMSPKDYRELKHQAASSAGHFAVRDEPMRRCLAFRHVGPYKECERAWETLMSWAEPCGLLPHVEGFAGLVYDDPEVTEASKLRYDAALVMAADAPDFRLALQTGLGKQVGWREIPAGKYGIGEHQGPYQEIEAAYFALLGQWLPQRGFELADEPVVELYLRGLFNAKPEEYLTEICVRLE